MGTSIPIETRLSAVKKVLGSAIKPDKDSLDLTTDLTCFDAFEVEWLWQALYGNPERIPADLCGREGLSRKSATVSFDSSVTNDPPKQT